MNPGLYAPVVSTASLLISGITAWLTLFRHGVLRMTQPTMLFFGPDKDGAQKVLRDATNTAHAPNVYRYRIETDGDDSVAANSFQIADTDSGDYVHLFDRASRDPGRPAPAPTASPTATTRCTASRA